MRQYKYFDKYLDLLEKDIYPEPDSRLHDEMTEKVFQKFILPNSNTLHSVLDVGCGQGVALKRFANLGINAIGITVSQRDYKICIKKGYDTYLMDQSFLEFPTANFDLLYARHVIEHSAFPLLTLFEFNRVLKKSGFLYIEVPWAESIHTANPNHYSTLGKMSWHYLFKKSNFLIINDVIIKFTLPNGKPDEYWGWWLKKTGNLPLEYVN